MVPQLLRRCRWFIRFLLLTALVSTPAWAKTEGLFGAYFHTAWTQSDGAPTGGFSLTQDANGWLWFAGGTGGLYRFDGYKFERMDAIDGNKLYESTIATVNDIDGALWICYQFGVIDRFKDGVLTRFGEKEGLPGSTALEVVKNPGGTISAATYSGVYDWDGKRWTRVWPAAGQPPAPAEKMLLIADKSLIIRAGHTIFRRKPGESDFKKLDSDVEIVELYNVNGRSTFWGASSDDFVEYDPVANRMRKRVFEADLKDVNKMFIQHNGIIWLIAESGLKLLGGDSHKVVDVLTKERGLSGEINDLFEDRDGNLWAYTSNGVDLFRRVKSHDVELPKNLQRVVLAPDNDGSFWMSGGTQQPLRHIAADGFISMKQMDPVESIIRGTDGVIWAADHTRLARYANGEEQTWDLPDKLQYQVQTMVQDLDGAVWMIANIPVRDLWRFQNGQWEKHSERKGFDGQWLLYLYVDERNRLWQGYSGNRLAVADGATVTRYDSKNGLRAGSIQSIVSRGDHTWVAGDQALMLLRNGKFITFSRSDGNDFKGIMGTVETADGDLWFIDESGIVHITAAEIASAAKKQTLNGGNARVEFERLDYRDGVIGSPRTVRPLPALTETPDGRLWYVTLHNAGWIDPKHIMRNKVAPPVQVMGVTVDDKHFAPRTGLRLPERSESLRIDYTAIALTMAERVRFRYRLQGVDKDWVDAGNRRSAYYTNLGPGDYRFEVLAANEDGVWNLTGATQEFSIEPTLVQTVWFRALCAAFAAFLLWLLHRWWLHRQLQQVRMRMSERLDERTRIARELHDTLLQAVQGLVLKIHATIARISDQEERKMIEGALQSADDVIAEGRERVQGLRNLEPERDLLSSFKAEGESLATAAKVEFIAQETGKPRPLHAIVSEELCAVGQEAIKNAFRHAQASKIEVEVHYGEQELKVIVRDNGQGIPADIQAAGGRDGHWGMVGMQERAKKIKAKLVVRSEPGAGTELTLSLPAQLAYQKADEKSFWKKLF
ncbi:histidine kinase [Undibacterium terreum]|uniref:Histidine kinase n=2 Tax=Undibacterium terreum TaxID=1224302 RepID=A0A916XET0_9BURK|nr:histidine kinase [Undibacterium terreum]